MMKFHPEFYKTIENLNPELTISVEMDDGHVIFFNSDGLPQAEFFPSEICGNVIISGQFFDYKNKFRIKNDRYKSTV